MNFDFSKFIEQDLTIEDLVEIKKGIEAKEINAKKEKVEHENLSHLTFEEKMDYWIEKYKDRLKIVYEDLSVICTFDDKTENVSIVDKKTSESVDFISREFFENAVFKTNTRLEKAKVVFDKFKEMTGNTIKNTFDDSRKSLQNEVDNIKIVDDIEDDIENIKDIENIEEDIINIPDID